MSTELANQLKSISGLTELENIFSNLSGGIMIQNDDESYEQELTAKLDAIEYKSTYSVVEARFNAYLKNASAQTIRNNSTNILVKNKIINLE